MVMDENYISSNLIFREKTVPLPDQGLRTTPILFEETCYQNNRCSTYKMLPLPQNQEAETQLEIAQVKPL